MKKQIIFEDRFFLFFIRPAAIGCGIQFVIILASLSIIWWLSTSLNDLRELLLSQMGIIVLLLAIVIIISGLNVFFARNFYLSYIRVAIDTSRPDLNKLSLYMNNGKSSEVRNPYIAPLAISIMVIFIFLVGFISGKDLSEAIFDTAQITLPFQIAGFFIELLFIVFHVLLLLLRPVDYVE